MYLVTLCLEVFKSTDKTGDLTIASPSTNNILLKSNYGTWEAMSLNTSGTSMNTSLYVSGTTTLNNTTTCISSLNVSGTTTLTNTYINTITPNTGAVFDVGGTSTSSLYSF